jgi:hypothetical protein
LHPVAFSNPIIKSINIAKEVAREYWQHRTGDEIKRDTCAKVAYTDYEEWVKKSFLK